jgi:translation initiation factor 2-alpha kinase 4
MPPRSTFTYIPSKSESSLVIIRLVDKCLARLPKTYPTLATPVFAIQKPTRGINHDHELALQKAVHAEAQRLRGSEMVFQVRNTHCRSEPCATHDESRSDQIITTAQEWLADHVHPPTEASGSLATEMTKRAIEEERVFHCHYFTSLRVDL